MTSIQNLSNDEVKLLQAFHKLDDIEQLIVLEGMKATAKSPARGDQILEQCNSLRDRHHAGESLTLGDLRFLKS